MKIGITGTRSGMTEHQRKRLKSFFVDIREEFNNTELHHGDCVGVDVEVAEIADEYGFTTISHPPTKDDLRAHHYSDETREPFSYFKRNRNIVDEAEILFVIPYQDEWQNHGGTWYTHDYGIKTKTATVIIFPDGSYDTKADDDEYS